MNALETSKGQTQNPGSAVASEKANGEEPFVEESLDAVLEFAENMLANLQETLQDYEATLVKRERIGGSLGVESSMQLKIRNRNVEQGASLAAYLKFESPGFAKGREVIWVEDENDGKIVSHEGGFKNWQRFHLDPNGTLAMMGNKYSIVDIGMVKLVEKLIEKGTRDQGVTQAEVSVTSGHSIGDRPCRLIEVRHPKPKSGLEFHIAQIFIDAERMIPLRYAAYLWPESEGGQPPLEEEYTYLNVRLNVGLPANTFDPDNSEYSFP